MSESKGQPLTTLRSRMITDRPAKQSDDCGGEKRDEDDQDCHGCSFEFVRNSISAIKIFTVPATP